MNLKMTRNLLAGVAGLSVLLAALSVWCFNMEEGAQVFYAPFEAVGQGLRLLSLTSQAGNICALILYILVSLLPVLVVLVSRWKRLCGWRIWEGVLLSGMLFFILYQFINPGLMLDGQNGLWARDASLLPVLKFVYAGLFYSVLGIVIAIHLIRGINREKTARKENLIKNLQRILTAVMGIYIVFLGYFRTFLLFQSLVPKQDNGWNHVYTSDSVQGMNALVNGQIFPDFGGFGIVMLKFAVEAIPILMTLYLLWKGIRLLDAMRREADLEASASALAGVAKAAAAVQLGCGLAGNLIQFLGRGQLANVNIQFGFPFAALILAFAAMILGEYLKRMAQLKEENEMFV